MNYPAMTESLIVMNAPHPAAMMREMRTLKQLRKSWYVFAFQIPWLPEYMLRRNNANEIGRMLRGAALQKSAFPREVTAKYQKAMSKPGAIKAAISYYRQLFWRLPLSFKSYEAQISAPTLLIWGEQDIALGIELTTGLERWVNDIQWSLGAARTTGKSEPIYAGFFAIHPYSLYRRKVDSEDVIIVNEKGRTVAASWGERLAACSTKSTIRPSGSEKRHRIEGDVFLIVAGYFSVQY